MPTLRAPIPLIFGAAIWRESYGKWRSAPFGDGPIDGYLPRGKLGLGEKSLHHRDIGQVCVQASDFVAPETEDGG